MVLCCGTWKAQTAYFSTYELLNQQHEIHSIRTILFRTIFRGFKQWNFSLKVLMKTGSFMQFLLCTKYRIGTVEYYVNTESQVSITVWLYIFLTKTNARHPYFRPPFIIFESVIWSSFNQCEKSCFFYLVTVEMTCETHIQLLVIRKIVYPSHLSHAIRLQEHTIHKCSWKAENFHWSSIPWILLILLAGH